MAIIFPSPAWAARTGGRLPLPKPQGSTSSSHPGNSTEKSNTANWQCTSHIPLWQNHTTQRKGDHGESCKVCYPDLPDSSHSRTRGHQVELAVVWLKTSFFFFSSVLPPSLKKMVRYTANAHLLADAGEASGVQGFKERQERSTEENPRGFPSSRGHIPLRKSQDQKGWKPGKE